MKFLNEEAFFERRGDRYVVRVTPFSAGYVISEAQKDALFTGLKRIDLHTSIEALLAVALIVTLFLAGLLRSETPGLWIIALSIPALAALTVGSVWQRSRLIRRTVDDRPPDLPRLSFWRALRKPRPPWLAERIASQILRVVVVLLVLLLAAGDALALFVIAAADGPEQQAHIEEMPWGTFWLALLLFNLMVVAMIVALGFDARRMRRRR